MNVQEQIKEWYQDRRFVNQTRVQERIRHVSEHVPDHKELDQRPFDLDDRYFVPRRLAEVIQLTWRC